MQSNKRQQQPLSKRSSADDTCDDIERHDVDATTDTGFSFSRHGSSKRRKASRQNSKAAEESSLHETGDFEDVLQRVGNYGSYQKRIVYCFVYPQACFLPFFIMTIFLQMHVPDHWCTVPGIRKKKNPGNISMDLDMKMKAGFKS
jgi:hypothetical protein